MSKPLTASAPKISASQPPTTSAWAKGPPNSNPTSTTPRSQSPSATTQPSTNPTPSHSRKPSALGGPSTLSSTFKDGVGVPKSFQPSQKPAPALSFGTIAEPSAPVPTNPASPPSLIADNPSNMTFGSVSPESVAKASTSKSATPAVSSSPSPTPRGATARQKFDVGSLFRNNNTATSSAPSPTSTTGADSSPAQRPAPLPQTQNNTQLSSHSYPHRSNGPSAPSSASPRISQYNRSVSNGASSRNGPPNNSTLGPSSPRMGQVTVPQQQPHAPQHSHSPHPVHPPHPHPHPQPPPGAWPPPYYMGQWYSEGYTPWIQPMAPAPSSSHIPPSRPPVPPGATPSGPPPLSTSTPSPYPSHSPYSYPYPPATPSTPQSPARLNSTAVPFVPQGNRAIPIRNPNSGQPVDLSSVAPSRTSTETPSSPAQGPGHQRRPTEAAKIRIESEESHNKRLEEERRNKEKQEKTEQELAARRQRDFEEKRKRREEEEERKRKKEEEERKRKEEEEERRHKEEERKRQEEEERRRKEEEERIREEEERQAREAKERLENERLEQERLEKERLERERLEQERLERERKEQEEREEQERVRKENEERERLQKIEAEKERERTRLEETERLRKEHEEKVAQLKEESEKKKIHDLNYSGSPAPSLITPPLISRSSSPQVSDSLKPKRPVPGPLDLSATSRPGLPPSLPSALATARAIDNLEKIQYPEGIASPNPELNAGASNGKFRYDREFLLQFMTICIEKPDSLPALDAIGMEPVTNESSLSSSRVRGGSRNMPPPSMGLKGGLSLGGSFGAKGSTNNQALMGQFTTAGGKMVPDDRASGHQMGRSTSVGGPPGPTAFPRATALMRTASQGGAVPTQGSSLNPSSGRTRSQRGRNRQHDATKPGTMPPPERERTSSMANNVFQSPFEPVEPLKASENRWTPATTRRGAAELDPTEFVERKVKSLLNKLTMEKFDSISDQIIEWANKSENEKDGRTLIQVIRLIFEKATDEAAWSEMYARLCRKMMEQISPNVQDETIRSTDGRPITGGQLFRKYLLNRCQEDFEQGWSMKEAAAKAAESKAADDKAAKDAAEEAKGEEVLYSDEYYAAQKAKRRGLGLVKFIGELFKLQMLTERIMHECIKKLLGNVENPEEEEIESLCKLFTTIGRQLDTEKSSARIDVYIKRMEELSKSSHISSRMQYMLLDVLELRSRKWVTRNAQIAPTTLAAVHEQAAKDQVKAQQEHNARAAAAMSRGGSRRGENRNSNYNAQPNADGWTSVAQPRPTTTAGDLTKFGKIDKTGTTTLGPASVFSRKDVKGRENSITRPASTSNMFAMLNSEGMAEPPMPGKSSRPPSRKPSADFTQTGLPELAQRKKLALLPRSLPKPDEDSKVLEEEVARSEASGDEAESSLLPPEKAKIKIGEDLKEFWALKNFDEADSYISNFPPSYRSQFVDQLIASTLERKDSEARIAGELLTRWADNGLCPPSVLEEGFAGQVEFIDDIAIDVPAAYRLVAILLKGTKLPRSSVEDIAGKIVVEGDPMIHPKDKLLKEYDSLDS